MQTIRLGRNDVCRCGSGRKFKKCCLNGNAGRPPAPTARTLPAPPSGIPLNDPRLEAFEHKDVVFVKGKGWTHERDLKPGDQYRLKGGGWAEVVPERVIGTTHEHPFYAQDKGWTPAGQLKPGEMLRTEDGWVPVQAVVDTGRIETVYNLQVEDDHTYFVGAPDWGFAVWAHNANYPTDAAGLQHLADRLTKAGFKPTQSLSKMRKADIEQIAAAMTQDANAFWAGVPKFKKVIIGPGGEVMDGHHRVIASVLSGVPIPESHIFRFPGANLRQVFNWIDVLPH